MNETFKTKSTITLIIYIKEMKLFKLILLLLLLYLLKMNENIKNNFSITSLDLSHNYIY